MLILLVRLLLRWGLNLLYETRFPEADPEFKACVS